MPDCLLILNWILSGKKSFFSSYKLLKFLSIIYFQIIRPDQINSNIINTGDLNRELFQVCEFQSCQRFELLYRGSEHNYNWSTFHAKCDNKSPTLVIVKSNDGCIFGGYTKAKWNGIEAWVADSQAFVFRLKTSNLESKNTK